VRTGRQLRPLLCRFQRTGRLAIERAEPRRRRERIRRGLVGIFQAPGPAAFSLGAVKYANRVGATVRFPAPAHMRSCMRVVQPAAVAAPVIEDMLDGAVATEHDGGRRDTRAPVRAETRQVNHGGQGSSPAWRLPAVEFAERKPRRERRD